MEFSFSGFKYAVVNRGMLMYFLFQKYSALGYVENAFVGVEVNTESQTKFKNIKSADFLVIFVGRTSKICFLHATY